MKTMNHKVSYGRADVYVIPTAHIQAREISLQLLLELVFVRVLKAISIIRMPI